MKIHMKTSDFVCHLFVGAVIFPHGNNQPADIEIEPSGDSESVRRSSSAEGATAPVPHCQRNAAAAAAAAAAPAVTAPTATGFIPWIEISSKDDSISVRVLLN